MCGKGDLHWVRESLWNGIWESENGTNATLCLMCVWFIVICMTAVRDSHPMGFQAQDNKAGGWDGANCGCHVPWTHTPGFVWQLLFRSLLCSQKKRMTEQQHPNSSRVSYFCFKSSFFLGKKKKNPICPSLSTWYLFLLCLSPSQAYLHPHIKPIRATVASPDGWSVAKLCWLVLHWFLSR